MRPWKLHDWRLEGITRAAEYCQFGLQLTGSFYIVTSTNIVLDSAPTCIISNCCCINRNLVRLTSLSGSSASTLLRGENSSLIVSCPGAFRFPDIPKSSHGTTAKLQKLNSSSRSDSETAKTKFIESSGSTKSIPFLYSTWSRARRNCMHVDLHDIVLVCKYKRSYCTCTSVVYAPVRGLMRSH